MRRSAGKSPFYGLPPLDEDFRALPAHRALLAAYEKLQQAKRRFGSAK